MLKRRLNLRNVVMGIACLAATIMCISCTKSVTDVQLNKSELILNVGETETLIATVLPDKAANKSISWASSNPYVATVMPNGFVTAIGKGTTTIMVNTLDRNKTANCVVTVTEISELFEITFPEAALVIDLGDETAALNGVTAKDAKGRDVTNSLKVSNLDYVGTGSITYSAEDNEGNIATKTRPVTIQSNKLLGGYISTIIGQSGWYFNSVTVTSSSKNTELVIKDLIYAQSSAVFAGDGTSTVLTMIPTSVSDNNGRVGNLTGQVTYKNIAGKYEIYEGRYTITWNNGGSENFTATFVKD